jgi:RNA polymerase sigma-70 factor (ECF subfamily)
MQRDSDVNDDASQESRARHDRAASPDALTLLLLRCAQGDRTALRDIYQQSAPRLRALALRITGDRMLADDVLHEVFVGLMHSAHRFDHQRGSASVFLTMVTRFKAMDVVRDRRREPGVPEPHGTKEETDEAILVSLRTVDGVQLAQCMGRLAPDQRRLIMLAFVEGRTHAELAKLLSIPLGTVKSAIRRGLIAMRRCLDE